MKIGVLKSVELKKLWSHEAKDFTPWLSKNLDILGKALGLDLSEVSETEKTLYKSNKRLDILASTTDDEPVIIENQLESGDDKHLGQILVYMISEKANIAVWVVKEAKAEYIKVIKYLNKELADKYFYLVELKAYKIGSSEPAPHFQVICKPVNLDNPSENKKLPKRRQLKIKFWSHFLKRAKEKTDFFAKDKTHWWSERHNDFSLLKGLKIGCYINQHKTAVSFVSNKPEIKNQLLSIKKSLEDSLGFEFEVKERQMVFGTLSNVEGYRGWLKNSGGYNSPEKDWDKIQDDLIDNFVKLEKGLKQILTQLKSSNKVA